MCPPIGFRAPPATKVIVAPGSAVKMSHQVQMVLVKNKKRTLNLIGDENSNLDENDFY